MSEEIWLEALLDGGPLPEGYQRASSGLIKLAQIQRAFAQLQWAEAETAELATEVQFHWDRLSVLESLGEGGFGEVYRARDPMLQREVALKLRRSGDRFAPAAGRAFIEEARRLAQVRHPNVLAVHGAAVDQGRAGIWTDLIQGETLAVRIERDGPLGGQAMLQLLSMLGAALSAVHARAIVHGDLKPANVMCESGSGRIILMDFGAGARLDDSGRAVLATGSRHYMAPEQLLGLPLGTAADLYALGVSAHFAATGMVPDTDAASRLEACDHLSPGLRKLLLDLQRIDPAARPSALEVVSRCHDLAGEPARLRRRRWRVIVGSVLVFAVVASVIALLITLQARGLAETERNRAVAARDFLLSMMRSTNPYQTAQPTRDLAVLFHHAVDSLPAAFRDDPQTEAQLLQQFGRSLIILDRDEQAMRALQRADRLLAQLGEPITAPGRIETRSFLSDVYRRRREFKKAIALTDEQASQCIGPTAVPPRTCMAIVNDQIEANGFGGDPLRALELVAQNRARASEAQLEADYEAVFIVYLQGVFERELGRSAQSLESFLALTERTLTVVAPTHPGLLTDLMWLAWSADDLGQIELARELNAYVLAGRQSLYGATSRYTVEARLQSTSFALHAGDLPDVRRQTRALLAELPDSWAYAGLRDQAMVLAALADEAGITDAQLQRIEQAWRDKLGEVAPKLAEMRLSLAAVALRRAQLGLAEELLERVRAAINSANGAGFRAAYAQLEYHLAVAQSPPDSEAAVAALERVDALLGGEQRRLFDAVARRYVGAHVSDVAVKTARIRNIAGRVRERREGSSVRRD